MTPADEHDQGERVPTNYLFIKKKRRPYLLWLAAAAVAVLASGLVAYLLLRH